MRRSYIALTILVVAPVTAPFLAPGRGEAAAGPTALAVQDPGKAVFETKGCTACHRTDAKGTPLAPDLTDDVWIQFEGRPTGEALANLIRSGVARPKQHPAPMPARGGANLTEEQITQVAAYVLSLSAEPDG